MFYILPKLTKDPIVGRPIAGGSNWITKPQSKYVAFYLQSYYKIFDTILVDRMEIIQYVESVLQEPNIRLCTLDAVSLYTNIPLKDFVDRMKRLLIKDHPIPQGPLILELLELILFFNILEFNGEYFIQIFGFAMGIYFAPIGSNIYLSLLEKDMKDLIVSDPSLSWPKF